MEGAQARQTVVARNYDELATLLLNRSPEFDLAILTPPRRGTADETCVERLMDDGAAVVVCTAVPLDLSQSRLASAQIVYKPFLDEDLRAACQRALDGTPALS